MKRTLVTLFAASVALTGCDQAKKAAFNPNAQCISKETIKAVREIVMRKAQRDADSEVARKFIVSNQQYFYFDRIVVSAINKDIGKIDCISNFTIKFDNADQRENFGKAISAIEAIPDSIAEDGGYISASYGTQELADGTGWLPYATTEPVASAIAAFAEMETGKQPDSAASSPLAPKQRTPQLPPGFFN